MKQGNVRLALAAAAGLCGAAGAQTQWTGAVNTDWLNPGNWSTGVVPGLGAGIGASVLVDAQGPTTVLLLTPPNLLSLGALRVPRSYVTLRLSDTDFDMTGAFDVSGTLRIEAGAFRSRGHLNAQELSGAGEIVLDSGVGHPDRAMLTFRNYPSIVTGTRIHGRGQLVGAFNSSGTITADWPGEALDIDPLSGDFRRLRNHGTLSATQGGTLTIGLFEVENIGTGTILADGGTVNIRQGIDIYGGTLRTRNGGRILFNGSTFETGVTYDGEIIVPDASLLRFNFDGLHPIVRNDGRIHAVNLSGGGTPAQFNARESTTFTGTGALSMDARTGLWSEAVFSSSGFETVITNGAGHTFQGMGTFSINVANQGTLRIGYAGDIPNLDQPTVMQFDGALALGTGGTVDLPMASDGAAGILYSTRPLALSGNLRARLEGNPIPPNVGMQWNLILAPSLSGSFSRVTLPQLPANRRWLSEILNGEGVGAYTVTITCAGDFNGDLFVDFFDYDDFVGAYESGDPRADVNADGFLDFFDYDDFVRAFEGGC